MNGVHRLALGVLAGARSDAAESREQKKRKAVGEMFFRRLPSRKSASPQKANHQTFSGDSAVGGALRRQSMCQPPVQPYDHQTLCS
jgi:hypothetical protein